MPAVGTIVVAAAAAVAAVVLLGGTSATVSASAARVLHQAARAARNDPAVGTLAPGQYLYTKSVDAYLSTTGGTRPDGTTWEYSVLVPNDARDLARPRTRPAGCTRREESRVWLSERDRQAWIADGRPDLGSRHVGHAARRRGGSTGQMTSLDLPSDPDALYAHAQAEAEGNGNGTYPEMFTLVGDALRENYTTPAQRAALYEVAARLPGIELAGRTVDAAGRPAIAVGMENGHNQARCRRSSSIPTSYALLGEEQTTAVGQPDRLSRRHRRGTGDVPRAASRRPGAGVGRERGEALGFAA